MSLPKDISFQVLLFLIPGPSLTHPPFHHTYSSTDLLALDTHAPTYLVTVLPAQPLLEQVPVDSHPVTQQVLLPTPLPVIQTSKGAALTGGGNHFILPD